MGEIFENRLHTRSLIAVGKIVKAFGVRGDVVILPMTENATRFKKLKRVFVGDDDSTTEEVSVSHIVVEPRGVRLKLSVAPDRTAAEKYVGALVFVDEHDAIRPPKGTFFIHDIIGMNVLDEAGNDVGVVSDVLKYPANDVYVIVKDGKELLLPAVKEFVKKIDVATKMMRVKLIEGLDAN